MSLNNKLKNMVKNPDTYRYVLWVAFFYLIMFYGIKFVNAGNSYEQAIAFRPFCVFFGLAILTMMDLKDWLHFWSLAYLPLSYVGTHFGYEKHWIKDICQYQFIDVIRWGKLVVLIWGLILVALIRNLILKLIKKAKDNKFYIQPVLGCLWAIFVILITIFQREYFYINFFLIGFTSMFYFLMGKEERKKVMLKALCDAVLLSLALVVYKSLRYRPYDMPRYDAFFANSNMGGMYFACTLCVLFYRIDEWWHREMKKAIKIPVLVFYYFAFGFTMCLALFNYARTTIVAMGFAFLTVFIIQLIHDKKRGKTILRYVLMLVSIVALFQLTYQIIRYVPAKCNTPYYFAGEYDLDYKIKPEDPIDSSKYTSMPEYLRIVFGKWGILINFEEADAGEEMAVELDNRDVTNGRIEIWTAYLERANMNGHYPGHLTLDSGYFVYHAHNTYLHLMYQYGIPAVVFFILFTVFAYGYAVITYAKVGKEEGYYLLPLLFASLSMIGYVSEWMGHPAYAICCITYLLMGILVTNPHKFNKKKIKR